VQYICVCVCVCVYIYIFILSLSLTKLPDRLQKLMHYATFEFFTAVKIQDSRFKVIRIVTPSSVAVGFQCFGGPSCHNNYPAHLNLNSVLITASSHMSIAFAYIIFQKIITSFMKTLNNVGDKGHLFIRHDLYSKRPLYYCLIVQ
jgi:Na+/proline symporter